MKRKSQLTTGDVAEHCSVSYDTVMNWISNGKLKAYMTPGRHRRVLVEDFRDFLREYDMRPYGDVRTQQRKILIVDDDPGLVKVIVEFFGTTGEYELATASDGFLAGIQVATFQPDLVVLDLVMPNMDGFEVCRQLRSNPETQNTVIVVITGYAQTRNIEKAFECGADLCLEKPFKIAELKTKVDEIFSRQSSKVDYDSLRA